MDCKEILKKIHDSEKDIDTDEIKCPFCGSDAKIYSVYVKDEKTDIAEVIYCEKCRNAIIVGVELCCANEYVGVTEVKICRADSVKN